MMTDVRQRTEGEGKEPEHTHDYTAPAEPPG